MEITEKSLRKQLIEMSEDDYFRASQASCKSQGGSIEWNDKKTKLVLNAFGGRCDVEVLRTAVPTICITEHCLDHPEDMAALGLHHEVKPGVYPKTIYEQLSELDDAQLQAVTQAVKGFEPSAHRDECLSELADRICEDTSDDFCGEYAYPFVDPGYLDTYVADQILQLPAERRENLFQDFAKIRPQSRLTLSSVSFELKQGFETDMEQLAAKYDIETNFCAHTLKPVQALVQERTGKAYEEKLPPAPARTSVPQLNTLSGSARNVVCDLFGNSPNRTARDYADALCDVDVLANFPWKQGAIEEAHAFFDEVAKYTEKLSDAEVEIGDRKETFQWAAQDCDIEGWAEELCAAAVFGDNVEDRADRLIEQLQNAYDARGVLCNVKCLPPPEHIDINPPEIKHHR